MKCILSVLMDGKKELINKAIQMYIEEQTIYNNNFDSENSKPPESPCDEFLNVEEQ